MAITIQSNPGTYYSAHGNLIWVVYEATKANDPVIYPDYKYVADVYIGGNLIARVKKVPQPDTKMGVFNLGDIIRNYVATNFNPTANQLRAQQSGSGEFYTDVQVKFGEDYDFTLYTNLTNDSTRYFYNHYNGRQVGTNTILTAYLDKALTTRPYKTPVNRNDNFCFIPFLPTNTNTITLSIRAYEEGDVFWAVMTKYFTPTAANVLQQFNVAPSVLNTEFGGNFIKDSIKYYDVEFQTPNIANDSLYRFYLTCEAVYTVYTLHFLNRFGGFESRNFSKVSRKTIDINKY